MQEANIAGKIHNLAEIKFFLIAHQMNKVLLKFILLTTYLPIIWGKNQNVKELICIVEPRTFFHWSNLGTNTGRELWNSASDPAYLCCTNINILSTGPSLYRKCQIGKQWSKFLFRLKYSKTQLWLTRL